MPIITIRGFGESMLDRRTDYLRVEDLRDLQDRLCRVAAGIPELELKPEQCSVFFPGDLCGPHVGQSHVVCVVSGLFDTEKRTPDVRKQLAEGLLVILRPFASRFARGATMIEVLIEPPFNPATGFAKWEKT